MVRTACIAPVGIDESGPARVGGGDEACAAILQAKPQVYNSDSDNDNIATFNSMYRAQPPFHRCAAKIERANMNATHVLHNADNL